MHMIHNLSFHYHADMTTKGLGLVLRLGLALGLELGLRLADLIFSALKRNSAFFIPDYTVFTVTILFYTPVFKTGRIMVYQCPTVRPSVSPSVRFTCRALT